jgi:hypothetical protein
MGLRNTSTTNKANESNWKRICVWSIESGYPDPREGRFVYLPDAIRTYLTLICDPSSTGKEPRWNVPNRAMSLDLSGTEARNMVLDTRARSMVPVSVIGKAFSECELSWGAEMKESSMIYILNCIVNCMDEDVSFERTTQEKFWFKNTCLTTHCFRRWGTQKMFFHEKTDTRWSLKMLKWWAGWSPTESVDVVMKHLLDESYNAEEAYTVPLYIEHFKMLELWMRARYEQGTPCRVVSIDKMVLWCRSFEADALLGVFE